MGFTRFIERLVLNEAERQIQKDGDPDNLMPTFRWVKQEWEKGRL